MADHESEDRFYLGEIDVKAAVGASLLGAVAFLGVMLVLGPLLDVSIWRPFYLIAAVVLGSDILAAPATFNFAVVATAVAVHLVLAVIYGGVLAGIIHDQSPLVGVLIGIGFGLLLYVVNLYFFTSLFPWFAESRNWVGALAHVVFGGMVGWVYVHAEVVAPKRRPVQHHT